MTPRPFKISLALIFSTLIAGYGVRLVPLGLPAFIVKYGGSMLWAGMIYWIVSAALSKVRLPIVGMVSGAIATSVEFFKLYHSPAMDTFRLTLPGMVLLGRYFSVRDIVAYWIAICLAAWVDGSTRRPALAPSS